MKVEEMGWGCSCGARGPAGTTHKCPRAIYENMSDIVERAEYLVRRSSSEEVRELSRLVILLAKALGNIED